MTSTTPSGGPRRRTGRPLRGARRATVAAAGLALVATLGATGCSGDDDPDAAPRPAGHHQAALVRAPEGSLATTTTIGEVTGRLQAERRQRLKKAVTEVVDGWLDAAYVGGDYPRTGGFRQAFPGFSSGAKDEARRDLDLMTNVRIAGRIDDVDVRRRDLVLDVLAVRGRPEAVTARVRLVFDTSGKVQRRERIAGRLYLTWRNGGWQVFGYDMTRGRS